MVYDDSPIVVAYCSADRELAEMIQRDLEMVGFTAVLHDEMDKKTTAYGRMVVVVSEVALSDRGLQQVWESALENGKRLCSVRVASAPLPNALDKAQWVDFALGYQVGFNGLKAALITGPSDIEGDVGGTEIVTDLSEISSRWIFYSIAIAAGLLIVGVVAVILLLIL
jgi:hypothetical protein